MAEGADTDTACALWRLHPHGDYFLSRGGDVIPPPRHVNLTLTNKCNLRCEICGSQKTLDQTKTLRHHMRIETFRGVAATLFPFLHEVELNSQGDPLLYPHIDEVLETLARHDCSFRIQHNGTLLTDPMIERLTAGFGILSLSLDAAGPVLDEVRRGAKWQRVEPSLIKLAALRDPAQLALWFYPTVTQRTVGHMADLARWAQAHGIDYVLFHDYDPVKGSTEQRPDPEEKQHQLDAIRNFLSKENGVTSVYDNGAVVHTASHPHPRRRVPSEIKARFKTGPNAPMDLSNPLADPQKLCAVPWQSLDINIEGQMAACCRAQEYPFGPVDTVEAFADLWLGDTYRSLRASLTRGADGTLPLPPCEGCIKARAPEAGACVRALPYAQNRADHPLAFVFTQDVWPLTLIARQQASAPIFTARLPLGLRGEAFVLFEDETPLPRQSSAEALRDGEAGGFAFEGSKLYFVTTDASDPLANGRRYELRRRL